MAPAGLVPCGDIERSHGEHPATTHGLIDAARQEFNRTDVGAADGD